MNYTAALPQWPEESTYNRKDVGSSSTRSRKFFSSENNINKIILHWPSTELNGCQQESKIRQRFIDSIVAVSSPLR